MNLLIRGKNIEVPENAKEHIEKKIGKLGRYFDDIAEAKVELSQEMARSRENRYVAEVTLVCQGTYLRGEERAADILAAVDAVADVMNRQIKRYKERLDAGKRRRLSPKEALAGDQGQSSTVVRVKRFLVKPMSVEEAVDQMELLGHDFFVFFNQEDGRFNVTYRRKDATYGLLKPELD